MNEQLQIRNAHTGDIADIERLARQIWPVTYGNILLPDQLNYMLDYFYNPTSLEKQMTQQKHSFILSILDNTPVGFASWSLVYDPGIYKLHKLYVDTQTQGKGIGKKLIDHIFEKISIDATALRLNVNRQNPARNFYEKSGFVIIGEEDVDIGHGIFQTDFVMEKKITRPS
jgi:ribosomal protein S18 acetylase RimI-like enzyme